MDRRSSLRWLAALALPVLLSAFAASPLSSGPARARAQDEPPSLQEISRRMDRLYSADSSVARMELTIVTPRRTSTMRMRTWSRGRDRSLIVIEAPARQQGTATLRVERNLWNYLPRISRTIRVPPSMMLSSWMGSDLTNDDLTHSASYEDDFHGRVVGRSERPAGWLVRYDAREGNVGLWRRIEIVMDSSATLPVEARYYDRRMRLARTMRFDQVREMDGRRIPTRLTLIPHDQEGRSTQMRYLEIDFDAEVPESTFSLTSLERRR